MTNNSIQTLRAQMSLQSTNNNRTKTQEEIFSDIHNVKLQNTNQIRWLRWILSGVIVCIAVVHLCILYYFLNKAGDVNIASHKYFLSDKVLMTFLGTTTADVFGLMFILTRFLFSNCDNNK